MKIIAGVDEVGRGSLIGPVYASAVILNKSIDKKLLKDSKSLTKTKREILSKYIKKNSVWAIGKASVKEIEKINILQASLLAMKRAIKNLKKKPALILIDGNKLPQIKNYNLKSIIKGDQRIPSISAASIIIKGNSPLSSSRSALRPVIMVCHPFSLNNLAVAFPKPDVAPVIKIVFGKLEFI